MTTSNQYQRIQRILAGDVSSFDQIYIDYNKLVFSSISKIINNKADIDDLVQEVFIKAYRKLHLYNPQYAFSSWIYKIGANIALDYVRKMNTREKIDEKSIIDLNSKSIEQVYLEQENRNQLYSYVYSLPKRSRDVILLYYYSEHSQSEISQILDIPIGTVHSRMNTAKKKLKKRLERENFYE